MKVKHMALNFGCCERRENDFIFSIFSHIYIWKSVYFFTPHSNQITYCFKHKDTLSVHVHQFPFVPVFFHWFGKFLHFHWFGIFCHITFGKEKFHLLWKH